MTNNFENSLTNFFFIQLVGEHGTKKPKSKIHACPTKGCNFSSTTNKDLNRHILIHTGMI